MSPKSGDKKEKVGQKITGKGLAVKQKVSNIALTSCAQIRSGLL